MSPLEIVLLAACQPVPSAIEGTARDAAGPVAGARVRIQTGEGYITSDEVGGFRVEGIRPGQQVTLTAWAQGTFISALEDVYPTDNPVNIILSATRRRRPSRAQVDQRLRHWGQ